VSLFLLGITLGLVDCLLRRRVRKYFDRMLAEMIRGLEEEERQTEPQITQINTDFLSEGKERKREGEK
jgi:hypothetical protein